MNMNKTLTNGGSQIGSEPVPSLVELLDRDEAPKPDDVFQAAFSRMPMKAGEDFRRRAPRVLHANINCKDLQNNQFGVGGQTLGAEHSTAIDIKMFSGTFEQFLRHVRAEPMRDCGMCDAGLKKQVKGQEIYSHLRIVSDGARGAYWDLRVAGGLEVVAGVDWENWVLWVCGKPVEQIQQKYRLEQGWPELAGETPKNSCKAGRGLGIKNLVGWMQGIFRERPQLPRWVLCAEQTGWGGYGVTPQLVAGRHYVHVPNEIVKYDFVATGLVCGLVPETAVEYLGGVTCVPVDLGNIEKDWGRDKLQLIAQLYSDMPETVEKRSGGSKAYRRRNRKDLDVKQLNLQKAVELANLCF